MTKKIDDLLSPERLRERWQRDEKIATASDDADAEEQTALQLHAQLKRLIEDRFKGDEAEALNLFLEGLRELLVQRFPETGHAPDPNDALDLAINETLNQIEDLVAAFEL